MIEEKRVFKQEFVRFMHMENAWPRDSKATIWIRNTTPHGIKTGDAGEARELRAIPAKSLLGILTMFLQAKTPANDDDKMRGRNALMAFLSSRGIASPESLSKDEIFDEVSARPEENPEGTNILLRGSDAIQEVFETKRTVDKHVQRCFDEDVNRGIQWLYVSLGRSISPSKTKLSSDEAISLAASHIGKSLAEYQERALEWNRFNPWTVVFARGKDKPTGISIMLPVSSQEYFRILGGEQASFDCRADGMMMPSRHIIVEAVAERPSDLRGEPIEEATESLMRCCLAQTAVLCRCSDPPFDQPIRFLSFASAPSAKPSLEAMGYKPTGVNMHKTKFELMSRELLLNAKKDPDFHIAAVLRQLSSLLVGPPEP